MTIAASGSMTGAIIRTELNQVGGDIVFPSATTRWLIDKSVGNVVFPTDFYSKRALKFADSKVSVFGGASSGSFTLDTGIPFPNRQLLLVLVAETTANTAITFSVPPEIGGVATTGIANVGYNTAGTGSARLGCGVISESSTQVVTVGVTCSVAVSRVYGAIYTFSNYNSIASFDFASSVSTTSLSANTADVSNNGMFFVFGVASTASTISFTGGVTSDANGTIGDGFKVIAGSINALPAQTDRPASMSWTGAAPGAMIAIGLR